MAKKILIVEDEPNIRKLMRLILSQDGYEIHEAEDGLAGLDLARSLKPDLLILDAVVPGMDGYRICEEVRMDPFLSRTFIIFVSGRVAAAAKTASLEAGGDLIISKPFHPEELRQAVKNGLAQPRING